MPELTPQDQDSGGRMTYEPMAGERIDETARTIVAMAAEHHCVVTASFNEIELSSDQGTPEQIAAFFTAECERRRAAYEASPEYQQRRLEAELKDEAKKRTLNALLNDSPDLALSDAPAWQSWVEANTDPYGACCMRYAEMWGRLMQRRMVLGDTLEVCADATSHLADTEGITGFMYGCAVAMLSKAWIHGEQLRRWHNLKTQIGTEGEKANESGGVLNPAILTIGEPHA